MAQEDDLRALGKIMDEYNTRNYECILVLL